MSKIGFTDKVSLNENASIPDINKCKASDMNEIKQVVNENDDNVGNLTNLVTPNKNNIVGAINSVVENGSNDNGSWIKFADGTMICRFTQIINLAVNTSWGSLYGGKCSVHDYPQEFIDIPETSLTLVANNDGNYGGWIGTNGGTDDIRPTKKNIGEFVILRPTTSANAYYKVQVIAIGKWK